MGLVLALRVETAVCGLVAESGPAECSEVARRLEADDR